MRHWYAEGESVTRVKLRAGTQQCIGPPHLNLTFLSSKVSACVFNKILRRLVGNRMFSQDMSHPARVPTREVRGISNE